jgi:hypothetical protein
VNGLCLKDDDDDDDDDDDRFYGSNFNIFNR